MYWKTLFKRRIYHSKTPINVYENIFFRWLEFDSHAIQTLINKTKPEQICLKYINALILAVQLNPDDCCMLGLGGGGAVHALSKTLSPFHFYVVEKNREVIEVAKRFFMLDKTKATIIHNDAMQYLKTEKKQFRHLLVDLFSNDSFPEECNNAFFLKPVKNG